MTARLTDMQAKGRKDSYSLARALQRFMLEKLKLLDLKVKFEEKEREKTKLTPPLICLL